MIEFIGFIFSFLPFFVIGGIIIWMIAGMKKRMHRYSFAKSRPPFGDILKYDASDLSYTSFSIPKKDGASRQIDCPNDALKKVQKSLLKRFSKTPLPKHITGFRRHFSLKRNAEAHVGKGIVINLDIKDFFMNVTEQKLKDMLTYLKTDAASIERIAKLCFYRGRLPQGAPTSPFLANFLFIPVDAAIIRLIRKYDPKAGYTRYADNITISSDAPRITNAIRIISDGIVPRFGYEIKKQKTNVSRGHTRQAVTGLVVNEKISLPRERYRKLRSQIHNYLTGRGGSAKEIAGMLSFLHMVDKKRYASLEKRSMKQFPASALIREIFQVGRKKRDTKKKDDTQKADIPSVFTRA